MITCRQCFKASLKLSCLRQLTEYGSKYRNIMQTKQCLLRFDLFFLAHHQKQKTSSHGHYWKFAEHLGRLWWFLQREKTTWIRQAALIIPLLKWSHNSLILSSIPSIPLASQYLKWTKLSFTTNIAARLVRKCWIK